MRAKVIVQEVINHETWLTKVQEEDGEYVIIHKAILGDLTSC